MPGEQPSLVFTRLHLFSTTHMTKHTYMYIHVSMRDEKEERKKQARSNKQTNKAKQHSTPKAVIFLRKNELPRVGFESTTLYTDMYIKFVSKLHVASCICRYRHYMYIAIAVISSSYV